MRAALFHAALSESFHILLRDYLKEENEMPKALWSEFDQSIWLQGPIKQKLIMKRNERPLLISQSKKNGTISIVIE